MIKIVLFIIAGVLLFSIFLPYLDLGGFLTRITAFDFIGSFLSAIVSIVKAIFNLVISHPLLSTFLLLLCGFIFLKTIISITTRGD